MMVRSKLPLNAPDSHCAHSTFSIFASMPTLASSAAMISPPFRAYGGGGRVSVTLERRRDARLLQQRLRLLRVVAD